MADPTTEKMQDYDKNDKIKSKNFSIEAHMTKTEIDRPASTLSLIKKIKILCRRIMLALFH